MVLPPVSCRGRKTHEQAYPHPGDGARLARAGSQRRVRGARAGADLPRAVPAAVSLHPGDELDERPERPRLLQGRVPPLLPAQPVRGHVGPHVLGARGEPRPRALGAPAGGDRRGGRRGDLLRQRGRRPPEHERLRHPPQPADGRDLHERVPGRPEAVARVQHRSRPHVDEVRGQPGARRSRPRLPRPEGLLVRARGRVAHGRRQVAAAQDRDLLVQGPQELAAPERVRARQRGRPASGSARTCSRWPWTATGASGSGS